MKNTDTTKFKLESKDRKALRRLFKKFLDNAPACSKKIEEALSEYTRGVNHDSQEPPSFLMISIASQAYRLHTQFITGSRFNKLFSKDEALNKDYEHLIFCFDDFIKSLTDFTKKTNIKSPFWVEYLIDYYTKYREEFSFYLK